MKSYRSTPTRRGVTIDTPINNKVVKKAPIKIQDVVEKPVIETIIEDKSDEEVIKATTDISDKVKFTGRKRTRRNKRNNKKTEE